MIMMIKVRMTAMVAAEAEAEEVEDDDKWREGIVNVKLLLLH